jgi:hypothetical protein
MKIGQQEKSTWTWNKDNFIRRADPDLEKADQRRVSWLNDSEP